MQTTLLQGLNRAPSCHGGLRLKLYPAAQWARVADTWAALAHSTRQASFYLDRRWVETWLEVFAAGLDVSAALFENAGQPVAACLLTRSRRVYGLIPLKRISLNAAGEKPADTTYIEFNSLICHAGWEEPVARMLADHLMGQEWDEFALDGFVPGPAYEALKEALRDLELEEVRQPSYYVDLAALRRFGRDYEEVLKSHRRRMVRQSMRSYTETLGPLRLEPAANIDAALQMLGELARLNRGRFAARGGRSVFESRRFVEFHRRLIQRCFPDRSVQFLRMEAGGRPIGLLYNLVFSGKVYFYQCGFDYALNPRLSPGIVTLAAAVQHYLDLDYDDFDFLSGEAEYKRMLATGARDLVWATFRRPTSRVRITAAMRAAKHRLVRLQARAA